MTTCLRQIEGCAQCAADRRACTDPADCTELCELQGRMRADSPKFHRLSHQPRACSDCGTHLENAEHRYLERKRICPFDRCVQFFCPGCRRYQSGWGEMGCPCDADRSGHGTYAEFPHPGAGRLVKLRHHRWHRRG